MKYIIASDFHLKFKENDDDKQRRLRVEQFLTSQIGKIDGLILAGDVFDLWVEWDKVIIKSYFNVLRIFSQLKEAGCRLIFLSGNHDFWFGDFLTNTIGFELYENIFSETINNKKIFISHGDLFTKNDLRYKVFRKLVRTKIIQKCYKLFHPDFSLALGQKLSRTSRKHKASPKTLQAREAGLITKAKQLSEEYDLIVFGHSHNPLQLYINNSIYINCGDWITYNTYCYFDKEKIKLCKLGENDE